MQKNDYIAKNLIKMYCPECGTLLPDDAAFCSNCGTALSEYAPAPTPAKSYDDYSPLVDSPEVQAALNKIRKSSRFWMTVLALLPLVIALFAGAFSEKVDIGEALGIGLFLSAVFLIINIINSLKTRFAKPWEGVVVDKQIERHRHKDQERRMKVLYIRTSTGKMKKIEDSAFGTAFNYFDFNDRLRFLPGFPFPYEKKDKSNDKEVICMFCSRTADISNDKCPHCHNPLIK